MKQIKYTAQGQGAKSGNMKETKIKHNNKPTTGEDLLKRTDLTTSEIKLLLKISMDKEEFFKRASNEIKYSGYILKQKREVESSKKNEKIKLELQKVLIFLITFLLIISILRGQVYLYNFHLAQ